MYVQVPLGIVVVAATTTSCRHGRGQNEIPEDAIRVSKRCREAMYGGFWKSIISVHHHMDLPLGQSDMFSQLLNTHI